MQNNADILVNEFEKALDRIPHLIFEIGYTRPTGWVVHLWNSSNVGIKNAVKIFSCQDESREDCFIEATNFIKNYLEEYAK